MRKTVAALCLVLVTLSSVQALEKMLLEGKETRELYEIVETDDFIEFFDNEDMSDFGRALQNAADCRQPKKKRNCRQPKGKLPSPPPPPPPSPPPRIQPSPPPPPDNTRDDYYYAPPLFYNPPPPVQSPPFPNTPPPPPRDNMCDFPSKRKILSGPRMIPDGGLRPCTGIKFSTPEGCCAQCRSNSSCAGWMLSKPLDCQSLGYGDPQPICYMLSEVTGSYDPLLSFLEYFSGTAVN